MKKDKTFKIKIDDGYCEWKYKVIFEEGHKMSIKDIITGMCKELKGEIIKKKIIKNEYDIWDKN